jgi:endogenous inhibitor of DNA gyrase (YacG/DUF329 family)
VSNRQRAGRTGDQRRRTGQGEVAFRCCPVCGRQVLSVFRGEVTAVGKGEILSVTREGDVVGGCECGKRVVWKREIPRSSPTITSG